MTKNSTSKTKKCTNYEKKLCNRIHLTYKKYNEKIQINDIIII